MDTIEGIWVGHLKLDKGYPLEMQTKYVSFEMEISDQNGFIQGICADDHTRYLNIAPATIVGTFKNNTISFVKTYPYLLAIDKTNKTVIVPDMPPAAVQYTGRLRKKLFSSGYFFKGTCSFSVPYVDKKGVERSHTLWSTWTMKKQK